MSEERWPIIDTHFHIGCSELHTFVAEEELIPILDREGVDMAVCFQQPRGHLFETPDWNPFHGNDYVAKIQRMFPTRVIGLATVAPYFIAPRTYSYPPSKRGQPFTLITRSPSLEEMERSILELGLHGLKMLPDVQGIPVNDRNMVFQLLDVMVRLQKETNRRLFVVVHCAENHQFNSVEAIADAARNYPDLMFFVAHCGFMRGTRKIPWVFGDLDNFFLDVTLCGAILPLIPSWEKYGPTRFVAGSDMVFASYRVMRAIVDDLCSNPEEKALVMGGNMARFLGIPKIKVVDSGDNVVAGTP